MPWRRVVHEYLVKVISENSLFQAFVDRTQSGISNTATRIANKEPIWKPSPNSFTGVFLKELKDGFVNLYKWKR
ncbi:hypothetical protein BASA50_006990 [Batrachochytrium salamandrivorans]|uniref:Uncharacterized protein n=1 Tax=Batrachochytrium salamandrivorans TaxID=1357716 RepID=A0ABQ8F863_9FUNG|nr:hypothetical protein BASA60_001918 [Batrachochytrium salamandrivorans]KAH6586023.1 hypothetical protein BASA61_006663 [Batrachochytrium salamandrivorans]KAH6593934.1 hypothetical protein BASA50_006990 [Batrachochytrium salamandrivorans]KAH9270670.1 hypothetical protein BASA83_007279 [Batrachochytrium salamandrivorans]